MFERFTEKSIKVIMLSQEEARRLGHSFVGTEQILLGLMGEGTGPAQQLLKSFGMRRREMRGHVERLVGRGSGFLSVEAPFTPRAKRVLEASVYEARAIEHNYIGTEHLLLGLLDPYNLNVATRILMHLGYDIIEIRTEMLLSIGEFTAAAEETIRDRTFLNMVDLAAETFEEEEEEPPVIPDSLPPLQRVIEASKIDTPAPRKAKKAAEDADNTEALAEDADKDPEDYNEFGIYTRIYNDVYNDVDNEPPPQPPTRNIQISRESYYDNLYSRSFDFGHYPVYAGGFGDRFDRFDRFGFGNYTRDPIKEFSTSLTDQASEGDPIVGRDKEIERVIQILARRRKNNPVLIGEPGVGKTAVAEGLAQAIVRNDVPDILEGKNLLNVDIGLLIAGTKYSGEF